MIVRHFCRKGLPVIIFSLWFMMRACKFPQITKKYYTKYCIDYSGSFSWHLRCYLFRVLVDRHNGDPRIIVCCELCRVFIKKAVFLANFDSESFWLCCSRRACIIVHTSRAAAGSMHAEDPPGTTSGDGKPGGPGRRRVKSRSTAALQLDCHQQRREKTIH